MKLVIPTILVIVTILLAGLVYGSAATAQQAVPEQSVLLTACQSARALATVAGLNMERCRRVSESVEGNTALVTVKVKITGQGDYIIAYAFMQTAWSQQAILVTPVS